MSKSDAITWRLLLTIAAMFTLLCAFTTYLVVRSAIKKQQHRHDSDPLSRIHHHANTIDNLMTDIKPLKTHAAQTATRAANQKTLLINTASQLAKTINGTLPRSAQPDPLNQRLNALLAVIEKVNIAVNQAEQAVKACDKQINHTLKRHNKLQDKDQDSQAMMAFLQSKLTDHNEKIAQLHAYLSRLDNDIDTHRRDLSALSHIINPHHQ